jgi:hypothetical protein
MSARKKLIPYMEEYDSLFSDNGKIRWLPYIMYFHPANHQSDTVNTDQYGFRYSDWNGERISALDFKQADSIRIIAGSSTVFGIGASSDKHTLASCLTKNDSRSEPWINFGGRSFNSTQELILMMLNKHLFDSVTVKEIVLFSGFNNLGLSRISANGHYNHGAFFNCHDFSTKLSNEQPKSFVKKIFSNVQNEGTSFSFREMDEQLEYATNLTMQHLSCWKLLSKELGCKLTFILQPLASWVKDEVSREERVLFEELDELGSFTEVYGDILSQETYTEYAHLLEDGCQKIEIDFIDISAKLKASACPEDWHFVDRIHFTDSGHNFVSATILESLK